MRSWYVAVGKSAVVGHSISIPNCRAWDPATAAELAVILDHAMRRMLVEQRDEFHYITLMNENQAMPSLPGQPGVREDILRGLVHRARFGAEGREVRRVRLLGSGTILQEVLAAARILADEHAVASEVFSVTSYAELAREAREAQRLDRVDPLPQPRTTQLRRLLGGAAPIVAASDYVRAWPQQIAEYLDARYVTLGTDDFGRSDTRQRLRRYFEVDGASIVAAALQSLRS
jgi:pyruvate dehydrogenase E1 component